MDTMLALFDAVVGVAPFLSRPQFMRIAGVRSSGSEEEEEEEEEQAKHAGWRARLHAGLGFRA
jgi:hypothetical protein